MTSGGWRTPREVREMLREAFATRRGRRDIGALLRFFGFLLILAGIYCVIFQVLMWMEGQRHSWATALYWTFSTMSTLGLGDIVFTGDAGRLFTVIVLLSGVLTLLVVFPYTFARFFFAPWLEMQRVPARTSGHAIITHADHFARTLIEKLELHGTPCFVIEPDVTSASTLQGEGIAVIAGEVDDPTTYERLRVDAAALVVANGSDRENANVVLTVREVAPETAVTALAQSEAAVPILLRAGATHVVPLKQRLGERLANRVNAGHAQTHVIGILRDLVVAEFPVHNTPLVGRTVQELRLREKLGVNIVGVLEQSRFVPVSPQTRLGPQSMPVVIGTRQQIQALDEFLVIYDTNYSPIVVVGAGGVGRAAVRQIKRRDIPVHVVDLHDVTRDWGEDRPDRVVVGDAAERDVLLAAGVHEAPGVLLTTNDDATNIYLAVHCRQLAPQVRIVSRVTHERNIASVRRAGADIALGHTSLGIEYVFAALRARELIVLGEGAELHELAVPPALAGKSLAEADIAARTGLNVIAVEDHTGLIANPAPTTVLAPGGRLAIIGDREQLAAFRTRYERSAS